MSEPFCPGCDHALSRHYKDITEVRRCLIIVNTFYTASGEFDGSAHYIYCDCENSVSKAADRRREKDTDERKRLLGQAEKLVNEIKERFNG